MNHTDQVVAELLARFFASAPESVKMNGSKRAVTGSCFAMGMFALARKILDDIQESGLPTAGWDEMVESARRLMHDQIKKAGAPSTN